MTEMDDWGETAGPAELPDGVTIILEQRETWAEPPPALKNAVRMALLRERNTRAADLNPPGTVLVDTDVDTGLPAAAATSVPRSGTALGPTDVSGGPAAVQASGDQMAAARHRRSQQRPGTERSRWSSGGRLLLVAAAVLAALVVGTGTVVSLTGSDATVVALNSTDLAPDASGSAAISDTPSGFSIELDIEGLPPAAAGSYYQAWLKNADGDLVTIGTFHARDGSDDIVLWSGVDPADYPTLTVTLQQEGGGAESSGQVVLSGAIG